MNLPLTLQASHRGHNVGTSGRVGDILQFWFAETSRSAFEIDARMTLWFGDEKQLATTIRERFQDDVERASRGEFDDWSERPAGRLALILLLDRFRRALYHGTQAAYAKDHDALTLAVRGIERKHDRDLAAVERAFFYMPLQRSESLKVQEFSVRIFNSLLNSVDASYKATFETFLDFAELHRDIVRQFGRFPHRNTILGRADTPEEAAYLARDLRNAG
jgi:uncharacterized protein (DUF924 family)